ncbi:MAG: hypothetical protein WAL50_00535, partial [Kineosporiaceae bacterium]
MAGSIRITVTVETASAADAGEVVAQAHTAPVPGSIRTPQVAGVAGNRTLAITAPDAGSMPATWLSAPSEHTQSADVVPIRGDRARSFTATGAAVNCSPRPLAGLGEGEGEGPGATDADPVGDGVGPSAGAVVRL